MKRYVLRGTAYAIVIVTTLAGVYLTTRGADVPAAMAAAHRHSSMTSSDSAKPVMLTSEQARRIGVTYAPAMLGALEREVRTVGQVTLDETRVRTITAKVDGFVERLWVNATGQPVSVGDPLFTIYSPMLLSAEEELLLAKRLQREVSAGSSDAQQSAADLVSSARHRLAYWDIPERDVAAIERSGEVQRTLTLRSSATGFVLEKSVVAGQRIMAGDPLYRVADLTSVWVEGEVFEQDLATVQVGQMVHANFQALPGEHRMGRISYVYPTVNTETRTVRVRVVLTNSDIRLKPGMYATLRIAGTPRPSVLTIPRDAVLSTGERSIVFVKEGTGRLAPREVALGLTNDERVEILRGLNVGDTVVASATFLVDAESNLAKALGGMGNMPGMDMSEVPKPLPMRMTAPKSPKPERSAKDTSHKM
jgi:membrane fusion protein, copper/silver efflux system